METTQAITTRRSVRQYRDTPVPSETVMNLLSAAMQAPSAMNQQPWRFVVIDDRSILNSIAEINPHADMCAQAPMAIVVCGDTSALKAPGYWVQDCSAATQNLLLAAHDAGLGAVWSGGYPNEEIVLVLRRLLALPDEIIPLALVPVGFPAEQPAPENRYREDRVHWNRW